MQDAVHALNGYGCGVLAERLAELATKLQNLSPRSDHPDLGTMCDMHRCPRPAIWIVTVTNSPPSRIYLACGKCTAAMCGQFGDTNYIKLQHI